MVTHNLEISGFHCPACAKLARMFISKIDGVTDVDVKDDGTALVVANDTITQEKFTSALNQMDGDYRVTSYGID